MLVKALVTFETMPLNQDFAPFHFCCTCCQALEKNPEIFPGNDVNVPETFDAIPENQDTTEPQADWIELHA